MTHDERISSYIDNELSAEQEQEFLISLAASDGLRKSFRSELVLKKVLHHDEAATNPPRKLRAAVFTTLGLGGATGASSAMLGANNARAAQPAARMIGQRGLLKSLFATKMSTLVTVVGISASALAGYGVRTLTAPPVTPRIVRVVIPAPAVSRAAASTAAVVTKAVSAAQPVPLAAKSPHASHPELSAMRQHHPIAVKKETVNSPRRAAGTGSIKLEPPKINQQH